jgi:hypothetical protein
LKDPEFKKKKKISTAKIKLKKKKMEQMKRMLNIPND